MMLFERETERNLNEGTFLHMAPGTVCSLGNVMGTQTVIPVSYRVSVPGWRKAGHGPRSRCHPGRVICVKSLFGRYY
jgi:hypothetical protein